MANITIQVTGSTAVIAVLRSRMDSLKVQINDAIQGAGIDTQAGAKQNCPVDTGRLRSSIQYIPGDFQCQVGTNVFYSFFVELGTCKMAARSFLYPSFLKAVQNFQAELAAMNI